MKTNSNLRGFLALVLCLSIAPTYAQFGARPGMMVGPPQGPRLGGSTAKLFGDNSAFSATLEMQTKGSSASDSVTMPGKIAFAEGKSRFEMDMTQMKGGGMPPNAAAQMKTMGMDRMVMISRPDKKLSYMVYPGMQAFMETPMQDPAATEPPSDFKVETTELGKESVEGHPCVKNKTIVTDNKGNKHEAIVWNATDLKNFPIKIEQTEGSTTSTMLFKDVKLSKPETALFEPPADHKRYDNMQSMMQEVMMKRLGGGQGFPRPDR